MNSEMDIDFQINQIIEMVELLDKINPYLESCESCETELVTFISIFKIRSTFVFPRVNMSYIYILRCNGNNKYITFAYRI